MNIKCPYCNHNLNVNRYDTYVQCDLCSNISKVIKTFNNLSLERESV